MRLIFKALAIQLSLVFTLGSFSALGASDSEWSEVPLPESTLQNPRRIIIFQFAKEHIAVCIEDTDGHLSCLSQDGRELHHWPISTGRGRSGIVIGPNLFRYQISNSMFTLSSMAEKSSALWSIKDEDILSSTDVSIPQAGRFMAYESFRNCSFRVLDLNTGELEWEVKSVRDTLDCNMESLLLEPNGEFLILVDQAHPEEEVYSLVYREAPEDLFQQRLPGWHSRLQLSTDSSQLVRLKRPKDSTEAELEILSLPEFLLMESDKISIDGPYELSMSPTEDQFAILTGPKVLIYALNPLRQQAEYTIPDDFGRSITFSPDGKFIYLITSQSSVLVRPTLEDDAPTSGIQRSRFHSAPPIYNFLPPDIGKIRQVAIHPMITHGFERMSVFTLTEDWKRLRRDVPEAAGVESQQTPQDHSCNLAFPEGTEFFWQILFRDNILRAEWVHPTNRKSWAREFSSSILPADISLPRRGSALALQLRVEKSITLLELETGEEKWSISTVDQPFGADNETILLSEDNSFIILSAQLESQSLLTFLPILPFGTMNQATLAGSPSRILLSDDGGTLLRFVLKTSSTTIHDRLEVIRVPDFLVLDTLPLEGLPILDAAFTPDQESVAFLTGSEIQFHRLLPFEFRGAIPAPDQQGVAFDIHPDGSMIYVATESRELYRIDFIETE